MENYFWHFLYLSKKYKVRIKNKNIKMTNIQSNGPGGCKLNRGVLEARMTQAQPKPSSSTSRLFENTRASCTKVEDDVVALHDWSVWIFVSFEFLSHLNYLFYLVFCLILFSDQNIFKNHEKITIGQYCFLVFVIFFLIFFKIILLV